MFHSVVDIICTIVIVLCGTAAGYIIGHVRGRRKGREATMGQDLPLIDDPDARN